MCRKGSQNAHKRTLDQGFRTDVHGNTRCYRMITATLQRSTCWPPNKTSHKVHKLPDFKTEPVGYFCSGTTIPNELKQLTFGESLKRLMFATISCATVVIRAYHVSIRWLKSVNLSGSLLSLTQEIWRSLASIRGIETVTARSGRTVTAQSGRSPERETLAQCFDGLGLAAASSHQSIRLAKPGGAVKVASSNAYHLQYLPGHFQ